MSTPRPVLLTVSGSIPATLDADVAAGIRPRADYSVMSESFDAELIDVDYALAEVGWFGRLLFRVGGAGVLLGWFCFERRRLHEVIVTDGEQVGLPFALLSRLFGRGTARHVMIVHLLSTPPKSRLIRMARLAGMVDVYIVYSSFQRRFICEELGVAPEQVVLSTFMVDSTFFDVDVVDVSSASTQPMICSAGLERRDYPTLFEAVEGLDVSVVVAAASPWSQQSDSSAGVRIPSNVEVRRLSSVELRETYARSRFVVMPLEDVEFQAGITTILEAMSMGLAVVTTRTIGQTDTIIEGETGRYVSPAEPVAMRESIVALLDDATAAEEMGRRARSWVLANADIELYARRLAAVVNGLRGCSPR